MSKQTLVNYILTNGKTHSWDELARMHGLKSGEIARHTWRSQKATVSTKIVPVHNDGVIHHKLTLDEIPKYQPMGYYPPISPDVEKDTYIAELEDKIVELVEKTSGNKKSKTAAHFNLAYNPLDYNLQMQKDYFLAEMKKYSKTRQATYGVYKGAPKAPERDCMYELSLFDLHLGKLAWAHETGEDYDMDIAVRRYKTSVDELIDRIDQRRVEKILLPIGNDMVNIDNKMNTTTAGTPQSADSRFGKMFKTAKNLVIETIEKLSDIAPVTVVVVPGNHDESTMFTLGEVIEAWFHNDETVTVLNSPKLRKYYQYGKNMVMFTHGDKENHRELGLIAATEKPEMWAKARFREVHIGHFHKTKRTEYLAVDEYQGFKIRVLPSLSGTDAWHHGKGYISNKAACAFVWHREKGMITEHIVNI